MEMLKAESTDLFASIASLQRDFNRLQCQYQSLQLEHEHTMGKRLQGMNFKEIDMLEKKLKIALEAIENRKVAKIYFMIEKLN